MIIKISHQRIRRIVLYLSQNICLFSEDLLTSPSFNRVIENIGQLPNGRTFKITVVLVSEQNGDVKESDPVSTFFRTRMFTSY